MKIQNCLRPALILFAAFCVTVGAQAAGAATATAIEQGNRLWEEGKLEEAQKRFEEAVKADPKSIDALMKLAGIQMTRLNYSGAILTYRDVLAIDPKYAKAWMGMGMCYLHSGSTRNGTVPPSRKPCVPSRAASNNLSRYWPNSTPRSKRNARRRRPTWLPGCPQTATTRVKPLRRRQNHQVSQHKQLKNKQNSSIAVQLTNLTRFPR